MSLAPEPVLEPHHRDPAKESQILIWIWNALEEVSTVEYEYFLRDGTILCRLMNFIKPGTIPGEITAGTDMKHKKNNIKAFLKACQDYGVPAKLLFEPDELLLMSHMPKVTRCLFAFGRLVDEDKNYKGPKLGEEPLEALPLTGRRRSGMPLGDDLLTSHVDIKTVMRRLSSFDGTDTAQVV